MKHSFFRAFIFLKVYVSVESWTGIATLFFLLAPVVVSAQKERLKRIEQQAEQKVRNAPDSALLFADSLWLLSRQEKDSLFVGLAYKLKGDVAFQKGNFLEAVKWHREGLKLAQAIQDTALEVRLYNNLARNYLVMGHNEKALETFSLALTKGEKVLTNFQKAVILGNLGVVQKNLKNNDKAEKYYLKALKFFEDSSVYINAAYQYNNLSVLMETQGKYPKALQYAQKAKELYEKADDRLGYAIVLTNIAKVLVDMGRDNEALKHASESLEIKLTSGYKVGVMNSAIIKGAAYANLEKPDSAILFYQLALVYADSLNKLESKADIIEKLAEAYAAKIDYLQANKLYKHLVVLKDSIHEQESLEKIAFAQTHLELAELENELVVMEQKASFTSEKLSLRNKMLSIIIPLALLTITLSVFYVRKFLSEKEANNLLRLKNSEIEEKSRLIDNKNKELAVAKAKIEHYNNELLVANEKLEEKVKERTRTAEWLYKKLSFHLNNSLLAVLEWDSQRKLIRWPDQAKNIFGWEEKEVVGLTFNSLLAKLGFEMEDSEDLVGKLLESGKQQINYSVDCRNKAGDKIYIEWCHSVILNESGGVESILSIAHDITKREEALLELKSALDELDTFLYKSSHDLRGPIARMQGIVSLGLIESSDPKALLYFNMLQKVIYELNSLLLRLHQVHNIYEHVNTQEKIDLKLLLDEILVHEGLLSKEPRIQIFNHVSEDFVVYSDASLLHLIIINLLENAFTFCNKNDPKVVLDATVISGKKLKIFVSDNGVPIPKEFREKIFELFFQGSPRSTGAGLGLYIARKAAKKLGGNIKLIPDKNLTIFEVQLPFAVEKELTA